MLLIQTKGVATAFGKARRFFRGAAVVAAFCVASPAALAALTASVTLVPGDLTSIYPGEITRIRITLGNNNITSPVNAVAFSSQLSGVLPNGLKVAGAAVYTCTNGDGSPAATPGSVTATLGSQSISLSGGVIPQGGAAEGRCVIDIPVTGGTTTGAGATYVYDIGAGAVTGNDGAPVANIGAVQQSIPVRAIARPTITKSFGTATLVLGGTSTPLTITLVNTNPVAIPGFNITDVFPVLAPGGAIIRVAAPPGTTASCNNSGGAPNVTAAAAGLTVSATGTIPARVGGVDGICTITVNVDARQTNDLFTTGAQANTIDRSTQFTNDLGIRAEANASANITVRSPLRVSKSVNSDFVVTGGTGSFTITLFNDGPTDLTGAAFSDSPIDGVGAGGYGLKVRAAGSSTTCGGVLTAVDNAIGVSLAGGIIPAGSSCTVTIGFTGTVEFSGTPRQYTNVLPANAVTVSDPAIKSQLATAVVTVAENLRIIKNVLPANAAPGNPVRYQVTVQNWSNAVINTVAINDALTNGQTYLTGTINGINFSPTLSASCGVLVAPSALGATAANFTIPTIPGRTTVNTPGACTVEFWAMTPIGGVETTYTNVLPVNSVCYDNPGQICNGGSSNTTTGTRTLSALSVLKSFNPAGPLPEGSVSRMTIVVQNRSAQPLTGMTITDNFLDATGQPGIKLRVAAIPNAVTSCAGAPVITAAAGATSVGLVGATVPRRADNGTGALGTCQLQVDVVGGAGSYDNVATVSATQAFANNDTQSVNGTSNTATLVYTSSLSATKSFLPAGVSSGGRSTVSVRLANSSAIALTNVAVTDPLPTGMLLANPPAAYTTCAGSTVITGAAGASSIGLTGATIGGNSTCDLVFDVSVTGIASWLNSIPVGNITADGGVRNQTAVTATLVFTVPSGLVVTKATNPSAVSFPGQTSRLTINLTAGTQAVSNLSLTDYFTVNGTAAAALNGMAIAATPDATTTCAGGVVTAPPSATSIAISGVSMAANSSCQIAVNVLSTAVGGITNFIPIGAIITNQGLTNAGQASTSLTTQANFGIAKKFTPNVVKPGERSRLRITFYNPTATPLTSVAVTDNLPANVTVPAGPNPTTTCAGAVVTSPVASQVVVSGGNLAAASGGAPGTCFAEIDVVVSTQGDFTNTIAANAATASAGGTPVNNPEPASDVLRAKQPLVVHKAIASQTLDTGNPVGFTTGTASRAPGATATLTIRLDNPNAAPLTGAAFTDTLPTGLVVATTPNAATTCAGGVVVANPSGTSVRLSGGTVPAAGFCTVSVDILSNISGSYDNVIPASGVTTVEGVANEEPTRARILISTPPTVGKQFSPAVISPNGTSTLTITLGNDNAFAITLSAAFADNLPTVPGNVLVAATPNSRGSCTLGQVVAAANSDVVSYNNGATIPAGGCTIIVDVTASTAGVHTNSIPVGALQTTAGNNPQPANAPLSVSTLGFISGKVFRDNNAVPNGTFESGTDNPIVGTSIELRTGGNCAGPLVSTVNTDASGNYLFSGLNAGTYSVCEPVQPTGTLNGSTTAGINVQTGTSNGAPGVASNPSNTSSQIVGIVLGSSAPGEVSGSTGNNFAEIVPSSISGSVFLDQNNNGVQNGPDTPIAGVTIELLNSLNAVVATTVTLADGSYRFSNLAPGTYSVREPTQPPSTANGRTVAGSTPGTLFTLPVQLPSLISNIVLPPNTASTGNNFAEIPSARSISGRVFLDYNNNGVLNGPDSGLGGQTINLTGTDINGNAVVLSTVTLANGTYRFDNVPEGSAYTLTQPVQPTSTTNGITTQGTTGGVPTGAGVTPSVISGINLAGANMVSADNNFAEIPGAAPDLTITKTHAPASFAASSTSGYYTIVVRNVGSVATSGVISVVDTLPAGLTIAELPTGSGWTCTGGVGATSATCTTAAILAPGASSTAITLRVAVAAGLTGQILINTAVVSGGGEPPGFTGNNTATDPVTVALGASVSGSVWRDSDHDRVKDVGEPVVPGWGVELYNAGVLVARTTTDSAGAYSFTNLAPGSGYEVRFRDPQTGVFFGRPVPNEGGQTFTDGVVGANNPAGATNVNYVLGGLTLPANTNVVQQSLPVDPAGVVYDSVTREPVAGAIVTISGPPGFTAANLVGGSAAIITSSNGFYQFLLLPGSPFGVYSLTVTPPNGYLPAPSTLLPACVGTLVVNAGPPNPALVQTSNNAPVVGTPTSVGAPGACSLAIAGLAAGAGTTQYYFSFDLNGTSADVLNNHIPLDPFGATGFVLTKTGDKRVVEVGDTVLYTIVVKRTSGGPLPQVTVLDRLPAGFTLVPGTVRVNGESRPNPAGGLGPALAFNIGPLALNQQTTLNYRARVGVGSQQSTGINSAQAHACNAATCVNPATLQPIAGSIASNIATYRVKVTGGVFTTEACLLGKIFVDCNGNHLQDKEELGIPGVRLYFETGSYLISDSEGKYSQCGLQPRSHVLKVDPRTLPTGSRLTTSSNRNLNDANSLFIDLKNGKLHRADFIEGSCSNTVLEQVKARRAQGEVRSVETEKRQGPALRFESKPAKVPQQGTDTANQPVVKPREGGANAR